ncbi:MAG: hypothetical protein IPL53_23810 [Ignavibacteria bacterium]|nr:hypothetical protein [Ignavibacteria bacterium]
MENILRLLEKIHLEQNQENKIKLIDKFQRSVWNSQGLEQITTSDVFDAIVDLAHDLEFYRDDPHNYGEEKMKREVETVLKKILESSSK